MPRHLTTSDETTANFVLPSQIGAANGVAALDGTGKVPLAQLPTIAAGSVNSVNGLTGIVNLTASLVGAVASSQVGVANGVAALDATGKIPLGQIPSASFVTGSQIGAANGVAGLDSSGHVPMAQLNTNVANGVAQLNGSGVLGASQSLIQSVNGHTGAVSLVASDVSAVPTSAVGAASGVASLNSSSKVPLTQIPDLSSVYNPAPSSTATAVGQLLTATGVGSNSTQWTTPLIYTAADQAHRPVSPPTGSLVTQQDIEGTFVYGGSQWFRTNADISIPKYASQAAVNNDFPSPAAGQHVFRTDLNQTLVYDGAAAAWLPLYQGQWINYTPTLTASTTNPTLGPDAQQLGRYMQIGKTVSFNMDILVGSSGFSAGSGLYIFSLPVPMLTTGPNQSNFQSRFTCAGSAGYFGSTDPTPVDSTHIHITYLNTSTGKLASISATSPNTFQSGDRIRLSGTYEAA